MKKIYFIIALAFILPLGAKAESLMCPVGQKVEAVVVTPAVIEVPAVTHTEVVVDAVAYDEVVIDTPAYTSCDYVGSPAGDYTNSSCTHTGFSWMEVYKKVSHPAVTHIVHHEAVTHEVVIIDVPAVESVPAVYEDQCVTDPDYVAPVVESKETSSSTSGHRRCYFTATEVICPVGGLTWAQVLKYVLKIQ